MQSTEWLKLKPMALNTEHTVWQLAVWQMLNVGVCVVRGAGAANATLAASRHSSGQNMCFPSSVLITFPDEQ